MPGDKRKIAATSAVGFDRQTPTGSANFNPATNQQLPPNSGYQPPQGPRGHNPSNRASGVWTPSNQHALTSGLAAARAPSHAPHGSRPKSVIMPVQTTPSGVASQMSNLQLNTSQTPSHRASHSTYNPSLGPTQSTITTPWRSTANSTTSKTTHSRTSSHHSTRAYATQYCKLSNLTRSDFHLGDLIACPFHTANTNPSVLPTDQRLALTIEGPVYSKRRMMVVLFIHTQDLYCLPLYSFGDRGLLAKPPHLRSEYVCVANEGQKEGHREGEFVNQGPHRFVRVVARRPLTGSTTVHLTGGVRVGCNEDITRVGRLTRQTYFELVELWQGIVGDASREPWR